jgi:hypothetical protein
LDLSKAVSKKKEHLSAASLRERIRLCPDALFLCSVQLHNSLMLAIMYNTTRGAPPPGSRHSGWSTRKLGGDGSQADDERDPKRRRIKETVLALGKRERARIKALGNRIDSELQLQPKGPFVRDEQLILHGDMDPASQKPKVTSAGVKEEFPSFVATVILTAFFLSSQHFSRTFRNGNEHLCAARARSFRMSASFATV